MNLLNISDGARQISENNYFCQRRPNWITMFILWRSNFTQENSKCFLYDILISDIYQMPEHGLFWYTTVLRTRVIASYCRRLLWLAVRETMFCTLYWFANHAALTCYTSHIWARHVCFQSKQNISVKDKDPELSSTSAPNLKGKQSFYLAQTMDPQFSCAIKAKVIFSCGILRPVLSRPISWKFRKVANADSPPKYCRARNGTCGHLRVTFMTTLRIQSVAMALQLYFIQWCENVTNKYI